MKPDRFDALEAEILSALRRAPGPEPSPDLDARILARSKRRGGGIFRPSRLTAIAATVLVLAGGGLALKLAQQVDTVPAALQPPAPLTPESKAEVSATGTEGKVQSMPTPAADDAPAREVSHAPAAATVDVAGQRQLELQRAQAARQEADRTANERRELGEQRVSAIGETVAAPPPAAPAPAAPSVTVASPMRAAPPAEPAARAATEAGFAADPAPAKPLDPASKSAPAADAPGDARERIAQSAEQEMTTHAAGAGATLHDATTSPETTLDEIRQLIAEGRRDEARSRLARLREEHPEFLVPAEIETLLEGDAPR